MRIAVCAKQIPDLESAGDPATGSSWSMPGPAFLLDDADRYGIEMGLQLAGDGGAVVLICVGPATGDEGLRQGLAMGAERAVHVATDPVRGADVLTTARAISAVVAEERPDLVITGTASADGSAGVMAQSLGELLGVPAISEVVKAEAGDGALTVERQTRDGIEVVRCALPAVISVTAGSVEPRFPSFPGTMAAKRRPVDRRELASLLPDWDGAAARMPKVVGVRPVESRTRGERIEDDGTAHLAILELLESRGVI